MGKGRLGAMEVWVFVVSSQSDFRVCNNSVNGVRHRRDTIKYNTDAHWRPSRKPKSSSARKGRSSNTSPVILDTLSKDYQVVILSDTFYEIASPLFNKLGNPTVFCHHLDVSNNGEIEGYKLRIGNQKQKAVEAFHKLGFSVFAAGDSYNDLQMFEVADKSFFINAPDKISSSYPEIPSFDNYTDLESAIVDNSIFKK